MKILVVDDDENIRNIIKEYASLDKHEVVEAKDGKETFRVLRKDIFDLIILDIMLPDITGYEIAKLILKEKEIPILFLSAKSELEDKLQGFESGAVDYITKPFSPKELMARLKVIQVKRNSYIDQFEGIKIDKMSKKVYVDDTEVKMTSKEFELLDYLIKNKNILLSREAILFNVWGDDYFGIDRTIDTHIKMIRKKIKKYGSHIVTVRGEGYRFE